MIRGLKGHAQLGAEGEKKQGGVQTRVNVPCPASIDGPRS
jgi:hypothetical protein